MEYLLPALQGWREGEMRHNPVQHPALLAPWVGSDAAGARGDQCWFVLRFLVFNLDEITSTFVLLFF